MSVRASEALSVRDRGGGFGSGRSATLQAVYKVRRGEECRVKRRKGGYIG